MLIHQADRGPTEMFVAKSAISGFATFVNRSQSRPVEAFGQESNTSAVREMILVLLLDPSVQCQPEAASCPGNERDGVLEGTGRLLSPAAVGLDLGVARRPGDATARRLAAALRIGLPIFTPTKLRSAINSALCV